MSGPSVVGGGLGKDGGRALKLQTDTPHLVSMGGDRLSTSVTLHPIPPGRVTLGSGPGVDIPVQGTGVLPHHCHIENSEGVVTIYPLSENMFIDGIRVTAPTRLSQGVMLTIGRSNYMRFNHPAEAKLMKSVLPNPRISMAAIQFEPQDNYSLKINKKPPPAPKRSPRESLSDSGGDEPPSSFMTKLSKFEYLAAQNLKKSYSPKVFSSNTRTVSMPVKDVLGKDISSLSKNLPQNSLNYSELNHNEKPQTKSQNQQFFNRKPQPQYVNVTVNETKNINSKVVIYENGCIPKTHNVNLDHNDLNNKSQSMGKNINVNRVNVPSPSFNRNPTQYFRSVTPNPNPVSNNIRVDHRRSGSLGEIATSGYNMDNFDDVEIRRNQAQKDRVKEQELEKAEQQRLEEILSMCAEYEKQSQTQSEKNKPMTPNRIITNGSLPRDKRHLGPPSPNFTTPPPSPLDVIHLDFHKQPNSHAPEASSANHRQADIFISTNYNQMSHVSPNRSREELPNYENVEIRLDKVIVGVNGDSGNYENVFVQHGNYPGSPRTKIKTFVSGKEIVLSTSDLIDTKFAMLETEKKLLEAEEILRQNRHNSREILPENLEYFESVKRKSTPTKFILPLEDLDSTSKSKSDTMSNNSSFNSSKDVSKSSLSRDSEEIKRIEGFKKEKKDILAVMSRIKRQMAEIEIQEEELQREIDLEKALISGEYKARTLELEKIETKKQKLQKRAQRIEDNMNDVQMKQEADQKECKNRLKSAQENMAVAEEKLKNTEKNNPQYEQVFENYLQAQEQLDNERKAFEDLEFHHLEEEADWLASKEEIQREIVELSKKSDALREVISDLDRQKSDTSKTNSNEYETIQKQRNECMQRLEEIKSRLKVIDSELMLESNQESEQEMSSDSDSSRRLSNTSLNKITDMSCSVIVSNHKISDDDFNMSQSFSEKMLQEKAVLDAGTAKKFPSQDDIDRISKVTLDAPISYDEGQGSLGRKTIESLKEIERNRHLHLCQQGSHVIEQERQRVNALKQKVQEQVKSEWEQRKQDTISMISTDSDVQRLSADSTKKDDSALSSDEKNESKEDDSIPSPRPLSDGSETSLEVGTLSKKRGKPPTDRQRPLTRYLPIRGSDLDLRHHIESAGHQVVLCPHVIINSSTCRGFLHKKGSKLNNWSRRWFVFDRHKHTLTYYADKSEKKPRGGAYFQAIEEVYLDHINNIKSPNPHLTFIVKTHERLYYLMAPSPEAMRIWVDVIFTGAEGYREFEHGT